MVCKLKLFAASIYQYMEAIGTARAARHIAQYKHSGI